VVFAGAGDAQPGWLVRCLSEFAFRGVNLTKIESRPRRGRQGHYLFHVDMEGRAGESSVDDAVQALHAHCEEVRLLGTYPAAEAGG
jgi:prephenate dehydratase